MREGAVAARKRIGRFARTRRGQIGPRSPRRPRLLVEDERLTFVRREE
jgi:hypothetical protein